MPRHDQKTAYNHCPACWARGATYFWDAPHVPTSSNALITSREAAIAWPRGDVRLAFCSKCGFIANTEFNPATQELALPYEATQACSPTFGKFASSLAADWIKQYRLEGKRLLEVGCGQGEFISMLCEMADATGWGVDPIVDLKRVPPTNRVEFIAERFSEDLGRLDFDFIVCRHTLEHIQDVARFLSAIRAGMRNRPVTLVIEIPDTTRVLREAAFWDIYYEHCSYFTTGSLERVLTRTGFDILHRDILYNGQYLVISASAGPRTSREGGEAADTTAKLVKRFTREAWQSMRGWMDRLSIAKRGAESVVLWGSGSKAVGFLTTLGIGNEVAAVVDINPAKHGTYLPGSGHEIISPEKLRDIRPKTVIVMNPVYVDEIQQSLVEMGLAPELIALQ